MIKIYNKLLKDENSVEVLSKGFSFLILKLIGTVFSFSFTLYITNVFGKEVWGLFALAMSIFTLTSILGALGIDTHLVKFYSQEKNLDDVGIYFKSLIKAFVFSSVLSFILYLLSEPMVNNMFKEPKPELLTYLYWVLPSIPFWSVIVLSSGVMRARKLNNYYGFYTIVSRFLILTSIVLLFSFTEIELVLKVFFYSLLFISLVSIIHVTIILKNVTIRTKENSWKFLKQSIPMMLSSSILVLMSWMDTFVMGIYEDESEVGIYNVAVKITSLTVFSLQALNSILAPKIAKAFASGKKEEYLNLISFTTKLNFFITLVVVFSIVLLNRFLLGLFGEGFESGFIVLLILCVGQLINSMSGSVGVIMQMIGEQNKHQTFIIISLVINLVLTLILTPIYGGVGAAIATVASMIFWNVAGAVFLKINKNIVTYFKPF